MATIKSPYTFQQYQERLQKEAHIMAIKAVQNIPTTPAPKERNWCNINSVTIKANHNTYDEVNTPDFTITFRLHEIHLFVGHAYLEGKYNTDRLQFSIEGKVYADSDNNSKIAFTHDQNDKPGVAAEGAKIRAYLDGLMKGIEPNRRFSLKRIAQEKEKTSKTVAAVA
jgi:hypothetical protein